MIRGHGFGAWLSHFQAVPDLLCITGGQGIALALNEVEM